MGALVTPGDHVDVLIVGAGISGIDAAYHLQTSCPNKSYAILEARDTMGGTWDLFRYPGIRSDSDMYTLGFPFRPWTDGKAIADGDSILAYIKDTAAMYGLGQAYLNTDSAKALSVFQRLVAVDPGYPGISDALREARAAVPVPVRIIRVTDRAAAEEIAAQLAAGGDFAELARARSTDPSAAQGGALGSVKPASLEPALRDAVIALPPGQVSAVIETPAGFAIVRREEG